MFTFYLTPWPPLHPRYAMERGKDATYLYKSADYQHNHKPSVIAHHAASIAPARAPVMREFFHQQCYHERQIVVD